ncbi:tetratricopeptide repeat protein [Halochromatium glycolicum]|uniref:Sel1 repeat family protein n=1 Tax=Halochromatium glycolicum TaxID=85075 RepID=A0AAJ0U6V0_9GAMM|nr:sel1 repeat family protein [Halochromatium glycolicum]MBK1706273.1 hypothetical protein [Halochromatium glycolicum]
MDYISFETAMSLTGMGKSTLWRAIREGRVRHIVAKPASGHAKARIDLDSLLPFVTFPVEEEERAHILAADTGNAPSQLEVALMLLEADQTERARPWLIGAARGGLPDAMCHLGQCLVSGTGVALDLDAAKTWLRGAAERGHALAAALVAGLEE